MYVSVVFMHGHLRAHAGASCSKLSSSKLLLAVEVIIHEQSFFPGSSETYLEHIPLALTLKYTRGTKTSSLILLTAFFFLRIDFLVQKNKLHFRFIITTMVKSTDTRMYVPVSVCHTVSLFANTIKVKVEGL